MLMVSHFRSPIKFAKSVEFDLFSNVSQRDGADDLWEGARNSQTLNFYVLTK